MKTDPTNVTPMMRQYEEVRSKLPANTLLLFRLGDFYELFKEDAEEGSRLLGINLTHRHGMPMAGIPYHAADTYIGKALAAGKKVAICDQLEAPQTGKLVKRGLTRILTPGTIIEAAQQDAFSNQYLMALDQFQSNFYLAWMDVSLGIIYILSETDVDAVLSLIAALGVREIIVSEGAPTRWQQDSESNAWFKRLLAGSQKIVISEVPGHYFDPQAGLTILLRTLGVLSLEGFGIAAHHPALGAAGALVNYIGDTFCSRPPRIYSLKTYALKQSLIMDPATQRNLELFRSSSNMQSGSLLECLNYCVTPGGARLLETYMISPSVNILELQERQETVAVFVQNPSSVRHLQSLLKQTRDIPRILARMYSRCRNPREIGAIRETLRQLPIILNELQTIQSGVLNSIINAINPCESLKELLTEALKEELPNAIDEGSYIANGYNTELDSLRSLLSGNHTWLTELERSEQEKTGIRNLKIKYNSAFGYFIEITKSNLHLVPVYYIRKQTVVNAERFYTPELKEKEEAITNAQSKIVALEEIIFQKIIQSVLAESKALLSTASALAACDVFVGWSQLAREWNYCKPILEKDCKIRIVQGRHPVVERMLRKERLGNAETFVPNDTELSSDNKQIALITGPNMAGKSTYIRQVALITLMAQMGCWVPADHCRIGLVDRIFSRVGASDELSKGNSTFMVEMIETANIINNATDQSLIILDEIGRGTSTYDGLSIAWAVIEHLHGLAPVGAKVMFATHYHELTQLAKHLPRLHNYSVAVREYQDAIVFVRQIIEGPADRSYGIHVAKLAGVPQSIIERAQAILDKLEVDSNPLDLKANPKLKRKLSSSVLDANHQLILF